MEDVLKRKEAESQEEFEKRLIIGKFVTKSLIEYDYSEIYKALFDREISSHEARKCMYGLRDHYLKMDSEKNKFDKSIMVSSDVHAPNERKDLLDEIAKNANDINVLAIVGDFLDCHAISSFPQIKTSTLAEEVVYGYELLKKIRKILNNGQKIIMCEGNHEKRYYTDITKLHEKDLQVFINPNILEMYTEGFTLYINGKKKKYEPIEGLTYIPHWYMMIDNIIMCHPLNFSQAKGKMLENVSSHFSNKSFDYDLALFGHTHKYSCGVTERFANKPAIENPCMCKSMKYADCGKTSYSPQTYGYTLIKYNNGDKVTLNNCKTILLDEELEEKNDYLNYRIEL